MGGGANCSKQIIVQREKFTSIFAKFTTVIPKDKNLTVRGSHMQLQLGEGDYSARPFLLNLTSFGNEALNDRLMDSFLSVVSLCRVIWSAEFPSRISIYPSSVPRSSSVILSRVRPHAFK